MTFDGRLDAPLLDDPRLGRVLAVLNPAGEETRLVGGAVRNALLGKPAGDLDLATTLSPGAVLARAKAARLRAIPTGLAHGTVTLMVEGVPFEVTTLREDVETDGRHAVVRFGRDFEADARRRDFTMNALSLGADGRVFDTVGGLDDLAGGRVRFIGEAGQRIREDYLRILRFFRFHATYGEGAPDADGYAASMAHRDGLARLSRERIRSETLKILATPGAADAIRAMAEAGLLGPILGVPAEPDRLARMTTLDPAPGDPVLRLAALAVQGRGDIETLRERLRLSNAETARLDAMMGAGLDPRAPPPDPARLARLLFAHGREAVADALRLAFAMSDGAAPETWRDALARLDGLPVPVFPLSGRDLAARGLAGPALGAALARLKADWAAAGFPAEPAVLETLLKRASAQPTS